MRAIKEDVKDTRNLLTKILDGAVEALKKPLVVSKIRRAFEAGKDSITDRIIDAEQQLQINREELVNAAKEGRSLESYIEKAINLSIELEDLKKAEKVLEQERELMFN